jgi:transposase InsO family protein
LFYANPECVSCCFTDVSTKYTDGTLLFISAEQQLTGVEVIPTVATVTAGKVITMVANDTPHVVDFGKNNLIFEEISSVYDFREPSMDDVLFVETDLQGREKITDLPEELSAIVDRIEWQIEEKDKRKLEELLSKYRDIFALSGEPLGRTGMVTHGIETTASPIRQAPRRIPMHQVEMVEEEMKKMMDSGVIRPSKSPWASPVVIVKKKDGTCRFCVDFRRLNDVTVKDAYPLPRIEDSLDVLQGSSLFSTLDLASGYWQVEMKECDKEKTAFASKYGLWEFNVMPFGLCNAPATFQRLMEQVLRGLQWRILALYLDDVIIFAGSVEEHLSRLEKVFERCRKAGLKLKPKKCDLLKKEVKFLGHVVSEEGVRTDPDKVAAIKRWKAPTNVSEVRTFIGMTSYYRKFIEGYAKIAGPLHELTKSNARFVWGEVQSQAFEALRDALLSDKILSLPDPNNREFILDTDASDYALGAVLSQLQNEDERVMAYGSRCLNGSERNYCVTRKELLAVVYFMVYYKHYLLGAHVLVRSDHGSLQWLKTMRNQSGQISRWMELLSPFHWTIKHRPGVSHANADALSRMACSGECAQCKKFISCLCTTHVPEDFPEDTDCCLVEQGPVDGGQKASKRLRHQNFARREKLKNTLFDLHLGWDVDDLVLATKKDELLGKLLMWDSRPLWEEVSFEKQEVKSYWQMWGQWIVDPHGLIWYKWMVERGNYVWKLVIPECYQDAVLRAVHNLPTGGHFGEKRSVAQLVRLPVYWFHYKQSMRMHCRLCDQCLRCKTSGKKYRAPMNTYNVGEPMERMALDIAGPFHDTRKGNRYILVVMDYFTKWADMIPIPDHSAETCAKELVMRVFCRLGLPQELHSDQGRDFLSELFSNTCRLLQIRRTKTTPWRPQSDGMVERLNRTIGAMLRQYTSEAQDDWDDWLPLCNLAYNGSRQSSTSYTPYFLMFGRHVRLPLELVLPTPDATLLDVSKPPTIHYFVARMEQTLRQVFKLVRDHLKAASVIQKRYYDRASNVRKLKIGQGVWLYNPQRRKGKSPKLQVSWEGPYAVIRIYRNVVVEIKASSRCRSKVVHIDRLVPVKQPYDGAWVFQLPRSTKDIPESTGEPDLRGLPKLFKESNTDLGVTKGAGKSCSTLPGEPPARKGKGKQRRDQVPKRCGAKVAARQEILRPRKRVDLVAGRRPVTRSQTKSNA